MANADRSKTRMQTQLTVWKATLAARQAEKKRMVARYDERIAALERAIETHGSPRAAASAARPKSASPKGARARPRTRRA